MGALKYPYYSQETVTWKVFQKGESPKEKIVSKNGLDYYPFGLEHKGLNSTIIGPEHQFKYNGKELQGEFGLNWYDHGARFVDPALGRWHAIDPLAEMFLDKSPYNSMANNPIFFKDPTGMAVETDYYDENNNFLGHVEDGINQKVYTTKSDWEEFKGHADKAGLDISGNQEDGKRFTNIFREYARVNGLFEKEGGLTAEVEVGLGNINELKAPLGESGYELISGIDGTGNSSKNTDEFIDLTGLAIAVGGYFRESAEKALNGSSMRLYRMNGTVLSPKLYTSGWTGGSAGNIKTYGTSGISKGLKLGGYGLGVFNGIQIENLYDNGKIGNYERWIEHTSNGISTVGGIYGAAWGIGWETGRVITNIPGYHENVRVPLQNAYRAFGLIE